MMELPTEIMAALLHRRECRFFPACLAADCMECVEIHMEKEGVNHGNDPVLCAHHSGRCDKEG